MADLKSADEGLVDLKIGEEWIGVGRMERGGWSTLSSVLGDWDWAGGVDADEVLDVSAVCPLLVSENSRG